MLTDSLLPQHSPYLKVSDRKSHSFPNWSSYLFGSTPSHVSHEKRRLLDRDSSFHQSQGKFLIKKRIRIADKNALYSGDWFHSLVNTPTSKLVLILLFSYMGLTFIFAIPYYLISKTYSCNLGISNFLEAFAFSLETMATIGFGTQDVFFDDCLLPIITLSIQVCIKLVADALTIGLLYSRIARPSTRANTILFTNKAIIRRIRGKLYLMFQICELRKHQLVEAHVRLYLVRHNREPEVDGEVSYFQTCAMRLNHPNDELGGMLLLCLPQVVVHEVDLWSPLYPPPIWASQMELHKWIPPVHKEMLEDPGLLESPSPDKKVSPTRSGYQSLFDEEDLNGTEVFPVAKRGSSDPMLTPYSSGPYRARTSLSQQSIDMKDPKQEEKEMLLKYMMDRKIEVVAIVEGTDAASGGSVQSRHSYTLEDIEWDHCFERCVFEDSDGSAVIDFSKFHETKLTHLDAQFSGIINSHV